MTQNDRDKLQEIHDTLKLIFWAICAVFGILVAILVAVK